MPQAWTAACQNWGSEMIEVDGPLESGLSSRVGWAYHYETFALRGRTPVELLQAYANWREAYEDEDKILVWRQRPLLTKEAWPDAPQEEPYWLMYVRCVKIPKNPDHILFLKLQSEQAQGI